MKLYPLFLAVFLSFPMTTLASQSNSCEVYPIVLPDSIAGLSANTAVSRLPLGTGSGNFNWVTWTGKNDANTFANSLAQPGDSDTYVNPNDSADSDINTNDWIQGAPGRMNSKRVRNNLSALIGETIIVPNFSDYQGKGSNLNYQVSNFSKIVLTDYKTNGKGWLSFKFVGKADCENSGIIATNIDITTDEDVEVIVDFTNPDNHSINLLSSPTKGTLVLADEIYVYQPHANTFGSDNFSYQLVNGNQISNIAIVNITVTAVNDAPVADSQLLTTAEDTALNILLSGSDIETQSLSFIVVNQPTNGVLTGTAPNLVYTPNNNFYGVDEFVFKVSDGLLDSQQATISLNVDSQNDAPVLDVFPIVIDENISFSKTLTATDSDGDSLTFTVNTQATNGTVILQGTQLTYTPFLNVNGTDAFIISVTDGKVVTSQTFNVEIRAVNEAPTVEIQTIVIDENASFEGTVNASDSDGDSLTYSIDSLPQNGSLTLSGNQLVYSPIEYFNGADSFVIAVSDGVLTTNAQYNVTVNSINQAPAITIAPVVLGENSSITKTVNATDSDNDSLSYQIITQPQLGQITLSGNEFTYIPNQNINGADSFTVSVSDGTATTTAEYIVTINPVNYAPEISVSPIVLDENSSVSGTINAADSDGDTLTYEVITTTSLGTLVLNNNTYTYTPNANVNGQDSFIVAVGDGQLTTQAQFDIVINAVNYPPVFSDSSVTVNEDTTINETLIASDIDGDLLTYSINSNPLNGQLVIQGANYTYTPNNNFNGTDSFYVQVSDGVLASNATISIIVNPVNDAPSVLNESIEVSEDLSVSHTIQATDIDGDILTYSIGSQSQNGVSTLAGNTFTYTPSANFNGSDNLVIQVSDGTTNVNAVYSLTVVGVNDKPVVTVTPIVVNEDASISVVVDASDEDGDTLTYSLISQATNGQVVVNGSSLTYTPAANYNGSDIFTVQVSDGTATVDAQYSVTVNSVNDLPTVTASPISTQEDQAVSGLVDATDIDGDTLSYVVSAQPQNGSLTLSNNNFTYTPSLNFNGSDSFSVQVSDGTSTATGVYSVTVNGVNDEPVVTVIPVVVNEDASVSVSIDASDEDGDTLTYSLISQATNGQVVVNASTLTYTPSANYNGSDTFTVQVSDGTATVDAQYSVVVNSVNDVPEITASPISTQEDQAVSGLVEATDVDGDTLSYVVSAQPQSGSLTLSNNNFTYTPSLNFNGSDSFSVQVSDGTATAIGVYSVTVNGVNDKPVVTVTPIVVDEDASVSVVVDASDEDGDTLTYSLISQATNGQVVVNGNTLIYTPSANYNGSDTFTLQVSDGTATVDAQYSVVVNSVNDAPVINSSAVNSASENMAYTYDVNATDSDIDDVLVYGLSSSPAGMTIESTSGMINWLPSTIQIGNQSVSVTVSDTAGSMDTQNFVIAVANVNDAPSITSEPLTSVNENTLYTYDVNATDPDVGDSLVYSLVAAPNGMTISQSSGAINWTPSTEQVGNHQVAISVRDAGGLADTQNFELAVLHVNRVPQITSTPATVIYSNINYEYLIHATDEDDDALSFELVIAPTGMNIDPATNTLSWLPDENSVGLHNVKVQVSDGQGGSDVQSFTLEVLANDPNNNSPVITSKPVTLIKVGGNYQYAVVGYDADDDQLTYSLVTAPQGMSIDPLSGAITWSVNENQVGSKLVHLKVDDGNGPSGFQEFFVSVQPDIEIPTHEGSDFWLMFNERAEHHQMIIISSQFDTSGTINFEDRVIPFSVIANSETQISLNNTTTYNFHGESDTVENKGVHIVADNKITVHALTSSAHNGDAMAVLPFHALSKEYMVMTYEQAARFSILATEDNTTVKIKIPESQLELNSVPLKGEISADGSYQVLLNKGETYKLNSRNDTFFDFTGTKIESDKSIAVFGGAICVFVPNEYPACDRLIAQISPVELWGSTYIATPLYSRLKGDTFRILAALDNTVIRINDEIITTLNSGDFHEIIIDKPSIIKGSHPISVAQFSNGSKFDENARRAHPNHLSSPTRSTSEISNYYEVIIDENSISNSVIVYVEDLALLESMTLNGAPVEANYFSSYNVAQITLPHGKHTFVANEAFVLNQNVYSVDRMADPFMAILPTTQQYLTDHLFTAPSNVFPRNFVNITVPVSVIEQVTLDGVLIQSYNFTSIPNSDFAFARLSVNVGSHHVSAPEPIGILVYGYNDYYSYGYRGGLGVQSQIALANLSIATTSNSPLTGEKVCLDITVTDASSKPIARAPIDIQISGANDLSDKQFTSIQGSTQYCYSGLVAGIDTITIAAGSINTTQLNRQIVINWGSADTTINHEPVITSVPQNLVQDGEQFLYQVVATDLNNDSLSYRFIGSSPSGMTIDAQTGLITWPQAQAMINGVHTDIHLVVEVSDGLSLTIQKFTLWVNMPPKTPKSGFGAPNSNIIIRQGPYYGSGISTSDPESDPITYTLLSGPEGMKIYPFNPSSIRWSFGEYGITSGQFPVSILIADNRGGETVYNYTLNIINNPPTISSTPMTNGTEGRAYSYQVIASDPDWDQFTYTITNDLGLTISTTGLVSGNLPEDSAGTHDIAVHVDDRTGNVVTQSYQLIISENSAPVFLAVPNYQSVYALGNYEYQIVAGDNQGDPLAYQLLTSPNGMTVNSDGFISWTPQLTQTGAHDIVVAASDGELSSSLSYTIDVIDPDTQLSANFSVSPLTLNEGELVSINVQPIDAFGEVTATFTVDGQVVELNNNFSASVIAEGIGSHLVNITLADQFNVWTSTEEFYVRDPSDSTAPLIEISQPTDWQKIIQPTEIIASINDDNLASWRLVYKEADSLPNEYVEMANGLTNVTNQVLATFDPTMLLNGDYAIFVEATDQNGLVTQENVFVTVEGDLKVGNFSITLEDKNIPLAGMPIRVTRTYDSRRKSKSLDFGFGWSIGYQDVKIEESRVLGNAWSLKEYASGPLGLIPNYCVEPAGEPTVSITLPNGDVERFIASASPKCTQAVPTLDVSLVFEGKDNTHSSLEAVNGRLGRLSNGNIIDMSSSTNLDPSLYKLTTRAGYIYQLDQDFGIRSVEDPNGNTLTYSDSGIVHSSGKEIAFNRNAEGRIDSMTDPKGGVISYNYNAAGDLESSTDELGNTTQYTYNNNHGLLDIIDPLGRSIVKNIYADNGRLIAQEDNAGNRTSFNHDIDGRQSVVTDRLGRTTTLYYDDKGNVTSQVDAQGNITTYTFDANDNQLTKVDALNRTTSATYNDKDDQLTQTDALNNSVTFTYNTRGQELTIVDESGDVFTNTYDYVGNLLSIKDPQNNTVSNSINAKGLPASVTDALGNVTSYTYDDEGNKLTETNPLGEVTTSTYDANNNLLTETRSRTLSDETVVEEIMSFEYDQRDRVVKTTDVDGNVSSVEFDVVGNQIASIDAAGNRTEMDYDVYGRVIETRYADGTSTSKTYDAEGNLLTETDPLNRTTSFEYDSLNRVVKTTMADGTFTQTEYDAVGQVTANVDAKGNRTTYDYDLNGRRTKTTDALGNVHQFAYDVDGNLISETDALNHTTSYTYDVLDRKTQTTFHNSSMVKTGFDALARKTSATDQANVVTNYGYDALGRLTSVTDALGNVTSYTYDEAGNKLSQTDAEGRVTTWTYDSLGRVLTRTLPLGQVETSTYDVLGNLVTHTNFNGELVTYAYDVSNRVISITYAKDGSVESFTYDALGNRLTSTKTAGAGAGAGSGTSTWTYTYDVMNRLASETKPNGEVLEYTYDANGNKTQLKVTYVGDGNSGESTRIENSTYDVLNRLETVTDADGNKTTYSYDAIGNRVSVEHSNANVTSYVYDELNRLTQMQDKKADESIYQQFDYELHATGRRTKITELNGRVSDYTYDLLYRLTTETITDAVNGNYSAEYQFDKVGNRIYSTINGVSTAYTIDNNDRLTQEGGEVYTYDDQGNTLTKTLDSDVTSYTYDARQKLTSASIVESGVTKNSSYQYNVDGIRTQKVEEGVTTNFLVDNNQTYAQVIAETDETDTIQVEYIFGDDLLSQKRGSTLSNYHYDGLGSTRNLTDSTGNVTDSYYYDAFGVTLATDGSTENDYLFTGEQFDSGLDNYYLRARYYDQSVGRFTQQDTWMGYNQDPVTLHKYLYANADPVRYTDPTGNFSIGSLGAAMGNVGALATAGSIGLDIGDVLYGSIARDEPIELNMATAKQIGFAVLFASGAGKIAKMLSKSKKYKKLFKKRKLMRGVNSNGTGYSQALLGFVDGSYSGYNPWSTRQSERVKHNSGKDGTWSTVFTSWTTKRRAAKHFATWDKSKLNKRSDGVIVTAKIMTFRIFKSPDVFKIAIGNNTEIGEGEWLVVGPVQGVPTPVR